MADYQERNASQVEARWRPHAERYRRRMLFQGDAWSQREAWHHELQRAEKYAARYQAGGDPSRAARATARLSRAQARVAELSTELPDGWVNPWHKQRAAAADKPLQQRQDACECEAARISSCVNSCKPRWRRVGCGQWKLCKACGKRRKRRNFKRFATAMQHHAERPKARYLGMRWYMLTLTLKHSGDPKRDADTMAVAFDKFWRWFQDTPKHRRAMRQDAPQRIRAEEMTDGADGLGHVHYHVCFLFPVGKVDYKACHRQWRKVTTELGQPSCVLDFKLGPDRKGHTAAEAATYLAKHSVPTYVAKGVDCEILSDEHLADWLVLTHCKRTITTTPHFFVPFKPECECCGMPLGAVVMPMAAAVIAWRAMTGEAPPEPDSG